MITSTIEILSLIKSIFQRLKFSDQKRAAASIYLQSSHIGVFRCPIPLFPSRNLALTRLIIPYSKGCHESAPPRCYSSAHYFCSYSSRSPGLSSWQSARESLHGYRFAGCLFARGYSTLGPIPSTCSCSWVQSPPTTYVP